VVELTRQDSGKFLLYRLNQVVKNQTMKDLPVWRAVKPAQMGEAGTADRYSPAIAGEPAEFFNRRPLIPASPCLPEAANLKYNAIGIKKSMLLRALHFDPLSRAGNYSATLGAKDVLFFFLLFLIFLLDLLFSLAIWQGNAQEVLAVCYRYNLIYHML
jgi:hypothetical protein